MLPGTDYAAVCCSGFQNGRSRASQSRLSDQKPAAQKLPTPSVVNQPVCGVLPLQPIPEAPDLVRAGLRHLSDSIKVVLHASDLIGEKTTRQTQGIRVLSGRRRSGDSAIPATHNGSAAGEPEYYRIRKIPSVGCYLKDEDAG